MTAVAAYPIYEFDQFEPTVSTNLLACVICGKSGAGKHYGIQSCLGCKTFFRRAVIQNRRYFCENNLQCDARQKKGRGPCAACRLHRCFMAGMTKDALHGRRDIILPKSARRHKKLSTSSSCSSASSDSQRTPSPAGSSIDELEWGAPAQLGAIQHVTSIDQKLRKSKLKRFEAASAARKLSCAVNGRTDPPFYYFTGLRIVDTVELAGLASMEMYSMVEFASTLSFFNQLDVRHRSATLRRFSVYQLVIETSYCTAVSAYNDVWMMPNGTCMPRDVRFLPEESQRIVTAERAWRQEKLYTEMTNSCIDDVAMPMRRLGILPEELATLKVVMFCQSASFVCRDSVDDDNEVHRALGVIEDFKRTVIDELFAFYRRQGMKDYEERFGNLMLIISGIVSTATFLQESYQVMRVFGIVPFDSFTEKLLFSMDKPSVL